MAIDHTTTQPLERREYTSLWAILALIVLATVVYALYASYYPMEGRVFDENGTRVMAPADSNTAGSTTVNESNPAPAPAPAAQQ